jgi:hypothetical protein
MEMAGTWLLTPFHLTAIPGRKWRCFSIKAPHERPIYYVRVTLPEPEAKEEWRSQNTKEQDEIRRGFLSDWGFGAGELVRTGEKIVKVSVNRPFVLLTAPIRQLVWTV